ncbi:MAG: ATPase [Chitinophagaceae bacterium]|nr:MAG: ATPase [Chitinophagaceae bacterium]
MPFKNFWNNAKEYSRLMIYDSRSYLLKVSGVVALIASFFSIGLIIYYHGFPHDRETLDFIIKLIYANFIFFILNFFIRFLTNYEKKSFIKDHWFEGILILLLIVDVSLGLSSGKYGLFEIVFINLSISDYARYLSLFTQSFILILSTLEILKLIRYLLSFKIKPNIAFIISFMILISMGTFLLLLPEMTAPEMTISFTDALFTAVSAATVTGLVVVDTGTYFTLKGQLIIMLLIQFGAIGIISFASFFVYFMKKGIGIKQQTALKEFLNEENLFNTRQLLKKIIKYTLIIEGLGFVCMYFLWGNSVEFSSQSERIFFTLFHTISAFCNAGFSLYEDGLMTGNLAYAYVLHILFAILIFFGSLGFPAIRDLFGVDMLRERLKKPWKRWKTSTIVAVYTSVGLIVISSSLFLFFEWNNSLADKNTFESIISSIFQLTSGRTAGFSTLETGNLTTPVLILIIFNMFIGGSSGSMAGGIKTSTFFIISLGVYSFLRGRKKLEFQKRSFSYDLLNRAFALFFFSFGIIFTGIFLLSYTETDTDFLAILFETVSATSIVGMSMGITETLSTYGKYIIIGCMFIGRIGPLTLAFSLLSSKAEPNHKYPNTHMMIG